MRLANEISTKVSNNHHSIIISQFSSGASNTAMHVLGGHRPILQLAFLALVVQIPFELRYTLFGLSNLQWIFVLVFLLTIPHLFPCWKALISDRLVQAAALFVTVQWLAVTFAPEFQTDALKAAIRFTAGFFLLVLSRSLGRSNTLTTRQILAVWAFASGAAALYALADYAGFGVPWLFRTEEFYIGQVRRLSGSFEYPNTAAAYLAMSLPIVWFGPLRPIFRAT